MFLAPASQSFGRDHTLKQRERGSHGKVNEWRLTHGALLIQIKGRDLLWPDSRARPEIAALKRPIRLDFYQTSTKNKSGTLGGAYKICEFPILQGQNAIHVAGQGHIVSGNKHRRTLTPRHAD